MKTLSSYGVKHRPPVKADYYEVGRKFEIWIIHDDGCQRQMNCAGLCSCVDPITFCLEGVP